MNIIKGLIKTKFFFLLFYKICFIISITNNAEIIDMIIKRNRFLIDWKVIMNLDIYPLQPQALHLYILKKVAAFIIASRLVLDLDL
jgi:hypothetical protein